VQEVGAKIDWHKGTLKRVGEGPVSDLPPDGVFDVDYAAACSLLARVEAIRNVGIWDPSYFVFWDDMEWGIRFGQAGWQVVGACGAHVSHESYVNRRARQRTVGLYLWTRNALYCVHRFAPPGRKTTILFNHFRWALTASDHDELSGNGASARAMRRAIIDFLHNRMGKPPEDVATPTDKSGLIFGAGDAGGDLTVRRVALLIGDNPDLARRIYAKLQEMFPAAHIDTIVLNASVEFLKEELPNRRIGRIKTIAQRLSLAAEMSGHYDATAAPVFLHHYFFEKMARRALRFEDDLTYTETHFDPLRLARLVWRRLTVWPRSAWLTWKALGKPRMRVDYFRFEGVNWEIYESRNRSHWREFSVDPYRPGPARYVMRAVRGVLLFPIALLTILSILAMLPILARVDRSRGGKP
jgi:hypothetical protein